jgi:hypothetical protein
MSPARNDNERQFTPLFTPLTKLFSDLKTQTGTLLTIMVEANPIERQSHSSLGCGMRFPWMFCK